jgi:hypothetical protein
MVTSRKLFLHEEKKKSITQCLSYRTDNVIEFLRLSTPRKFVFQTQIVFNTQSKQENILENLVLLTLKQKDKILIFAPDLLYGQILIKQKKNK